MRIAALALHGNAPWPDDNLAERQGYIARPSWPAIGVDQLDAGLNVFHGPPASGKTAIADLVAHALCGRRFLPASRGRVSPRLDDCSLGETAPPETESTPAPEGELVVESGGHRFRLRRSRDNTNTERLTVAALDGAAVDGNTVRELVYGLSPTLLGPMYVANFREPLRPETLLAGTFAEEFRAVFGGAAAQASAVRDDLQPIHQRIQALEWEIKTLVAALGYRRTRRRASNTKVRPTDNPNRASHFLARLTDGELVRLQHSRKRQGALVVTRTGTLKALETIPTSQRDQVYLSLCLALVSACAQRGVQLPLVLDEPFVRRDQRESATLAAVLHDFARRGHQVLIFTARQDAAERFAKLGATTHDMLALTGRRADAAFAVVHETKTQGENGAENVERQTTRVIKRKRRRAG